MFDQEVLTLLVNLNHNRSQIVSENDLRELSERILAIVVNGLVIVNFWYDVENITVK